MGKETKHSGTAHGKIILIGEHSVVHFKPAIALPLMSTEIRAEVSGNGSPASILQAVLRMRPETWATSRNSW